METNFRPDGASFFALDIEVPEDSLTERDNQPPRRGS